MKRSQLLRCDSISAPRSIPWRRVRAALVGRVISQWGMAFPAEFGRAGPRAWIFDVGTDANFPRKAIARKEGLHGASSRFQFCTESRLSALIEFFSTAVREPDSDLLEMVSTLGQSNWSVH